MSGKVRFVSAWNDEISEDHLISIRYHIDKPNSNATYWSKEHGKFTSEFIGYMSLNGWTHIDDAKEIVGKELDENDVEDVFIGGDSSGGSQ
jgi:hypothetical protein